MQSDSEFGTYSDSYDGDMLSSVDEYSALLDADLNDEEVG